MQLICRHCGRISTSVLIKQEESAAEILKDFMTHLVTAHPNIQQSIMQDTMKVSAISASVITLAKHTTLLDTDVDVTDFIQIEFDKMVTELEDTLGIEVSKLEGEHESIPLNPVDPKPPQTINTNFQPKAGSRIILG